MTMGVEPLGHAHELVALLGIKQAPHVFRW
jgi:hypothetical protein